MSLLQASGVMLSRGGRCLIEGLDFTLAAGQVCVVLGPNGAGKSSLLLALAGLIPLAGRIQLNGHALSAYRRPELVRQIAWQGELPGTEFGLTVRQRLELAANGANADVAACAAAMEMGELLARPLGELSAGERQRTELAALMLRDVPLWLLDEPTAHLDLRHQVLCIDMLRRQRDAGRALLVVLHDLQQAMAVADHVILVDGQGRAEYREATMIETERLSRLYGTPLVGRGSEIAPLYGAVR